MLCEVNKKVYLSRLHILEKLEETTSSQNLTWTTATSKTSTLAMLPDISDASSDAASNSGPELPAEDEDEEENN